MGARVRLPEGRIEATLGRGVVVDSDEARQPSLIRLLALNERSPLYPYVVDRVSWPKRSPWTATLKVGRYVVESMDQPFGALRGGPAFRYLCVSVDGAGWETEVQALVALGAVEALQALGLDDAAVTLAMGDLDGARVQWIRLHDGR
ncbi:MAG: hypothetical protein MUC96_23000 [Myxococcaceae bacterium]|jgi:hypothetical protein|nr:hypothetical protein [Myxococcaceae bacterium]